MEERAVFQAGKQKEFIDFVRRELSLKEFIKKNKLQVNYNTFKGYYSERLSLPFSTLKRLCEISGLNEKGLNIKILPGNWGCVEGGKRGMKTLLNKYGQHIKKWRRLGAEKSRLGIKSLKKISLPKRMNEKLAELIGIYLGDGSLTDYFMRVSGDKRYDTKYFNYIGRLIWDLFKIESTIRSEKTANTFYVELRSKRFCDFFKRLGLKPGDKIKNRTKIPNIIIKNKKLSVACLRGLVDTDGSVAKDGGTLCIRFAAHNEILLDQVEKIGRSLGYFTFRSKRQAGTRNVKCIKKYFKEVGSSNPSHIIRFCEFLNGNILKKSEVLNYNKVYEHVNLPFKIDGSVV